MTEVAKLLREAKTIAVVGLSNDPMRASHGVAAYMQQQGYRIIPVNPNETQVLGERSYPDLASVPVPIDIVDVFRRSEFVPDLMREAIGVGAKAFWMQEGVEHAAAAAEGRAAGLVVVENRCILKEHYRL
jgi:predicted CoA-binding protein